MIKGFRDFILRGNVMDLAVAVIIGAAFSAIVTALTTNIISPLIGAIVGKPSFDNLTTTVNGGVIKYGTFFTAVINFLIIAFVLFMVIRAMNTLKRKDEAAPAAPPKPTREEELLTEIRDLLKKS